MEAIHGVLEWFIMIFVTLAGFAVGRWVPAHRFRILFGAVLLLTAFIFDLNNVKFRSEIANFVFYLLILVTVSETFWACVRKNSKILLSGALVMLIPVFIYVYAAMLLILPLPCHENRSELVSGYAGCDFGNYTVRKRLSFDPFSPAMLYTLSRNIRKTPLRKQVDKFTAPRGYVEAAFAPEWQCRADGKAKALLFIDGYLLWTLEEKSEEEKYGAAPKTGL